MMYVKFASDPAQFASAKAVTILKLWMSSPRLFALPFGEHYVLVTRERQVRYLYG